MIFLLLLLVSPFARAGEEQFTLRVQHYEDARRPGFDRKAFEGREWDLNGLFRSAQLQWVQAGVERAVSGAGHTYCLRVRQTTNGKLTGQPVPYRERLQIFANLARQLQMRQSEMTHAGAHFRVELGSRCGTFQDTRQARR
jgi:hypothetical protein